MAREAVEARWIKAGKKKPTAKAIHEGMLCLGDMEIPCAVLEDKRRLITQSGFMVALGRARQAKGRQYYKGDVNLPAFLTAQNLKPFIPKDLEVTSSQIEFRTLGRGTERFGSVRVRFLKAMATLPSGTSASLRARLGKTGLCPGKTGLCPAWVTQ